MVDEEDLVQCSAEQRMCENAAWGRIFEG